ncbi:MAG: hypothetical protein A3F82_06010 [Deltaproteobacteria bacterium RIFCSPLOWO2_12_FULL_44_12]|nr:MAG: hypothetical protein A2712_01295 [Deltaproteobacteria bacterium RIFCSPHIGHO2_01_FULL_43_49]OGQ15230.1 MAG: hypothetical protein A3D22_04180 [Deltaproteobacteria bacterium RIFCSPHIGHO2_02_FULL_44_53]OGQ27147.1 MAG: hypothetical protein A3D98_01885 [Deltaproteobacteria bacterium RIFCSPHIGHO2_12_FULL_44_21]OGQ31747.1 MAG: hypothetical protein A2979_05340 [Deltaproteobacteria bacterium RIFCSPLOWO2_01_FULL_45_74]OGQ42947.1 MAG: hypothetical protein A3I70_07645 [Deltaproteobacteria bacterium 
MNRREFLKTLTVGTGAGLLTGTGLFRWWHLKKPRLFKETRSLLGTFVTITVRHPDQFQVEAAIGEAFQAIEKVDRVMSVHRKESDLSRVNFHAGNDMVLVDSSLSDILKIAGSFYTLTGGIYDVTCLPLMQLYGFYQEGKKNRRYPSDRLIHKALSQIGGHYVQIDAMKAQVGLTKVGAGIDLGSIGKGYAIDRAGDALRAAGIEEALIDAGGNVLAIGSWEVAILNPYGGPKNPYFETFTLKDAAVATSGNYEQGVWLDGRRVGHLFDAKKGHPSDPGISATVVARNATLADTLSTSCFLLGPKAEARFKKLASAIYYHGYAG